MRSGTPCDDGCSSSESEIDGETDLLAAISQQLVVTADDRDAAPQGEAVAHAVEAATGIVRPAEESDAAGAPEGAPSADPH